ncbi:MarC family (MarC) (PUBMED:17954692 [Commensalibacter communis]|uniref:UPF0056 membrane protein n=1 Tax=Commensalibacter communis TaxID=2972786 RepID=A0A9W4X6M0_9PROT|nr:MarC family protein [Commensalibacter communis]CAI3935173.1 MarC family (MarC) (PUBMED:17954692 [Commensalibacter communis]CAI3937150.1 MarC family (MarC) (PUBMED:17954692 [Commensalibacter communis]CAI3938356.1 MarC family (MarC) (PUBMED:17954692 [Commensalibacter communis]CAI3939620.1 MarC family (MarC) (PUBMED:17954692 [Commensalibacter communis]CAI3942851.1 MarC family (MarC) (PUBMED:17954692 [Commensalibacter communis]
MHLTESLPLLHTFTSISGSFLFAFLALIPIADPLGSCLIFYQVTEEREDAERRILARKIAIYAFIILAFSVFIGEFALRFFGISLHAVRIAGGLVIAVRAWSLLNAPEQNADRKQKEAEQGGRTMALPNGLDAAFFPLTMPFTIGPGCIAVAISLSSYRPAENITKIFNFYGGLLFAIISVCLIILLAYTFCDKIMKVLGKSRARILSRLAALVLLCIGVQIVGTGIQGFLMPIFHQT